jgi:hypothetical protein
MKDEYFVYLFLAGLALAVVGFVWLVVLAFLERIWWGVGSIVFPPVALVFSYRYPRRSWLPCITLALGIFLMAFPALYTRLAPVDLGPREKLVDGEYHVTLTGWDRSDYSILASRPGTVVLQMANPDVTDQSLRFLKGMTRLRELDLNDTAITDTGLDVLTSLSGLEILRLRNTRISDAGFQNRLALMESLRQLDLRGTAITSESIAAWRQSKPGRRAMK